MVSNDGVSGSGNLGSVSASEIAIIITPLFTKLPWPGDSEETFRSSSQAAYLSTTYGGGFTLSF